MKYLILYDAKCNYCNLFKGIVLLFDLHRRLVPIELAPNTIKYLKEMDYSPVFNSFHLISSKGLVYSGGEAIPHLISILINSKLIDRFLTNLRTKKIFDASYNLLARVTSRSRCKHVES
jgi:predicted DCC family thiol-disulfide oxidoreductase YuxK